MTDKVDTEPNNAGHLYEHLRRTPRFKASDIREMVVIIQRAAGCEPREVRGKILDLSLGGAKLSVAVEVGSQERINVRWDLDELELDFHTAATVCWVRTESGNSWRLGCSFEKQLPDSLISQLSVHGYVDRRQTPRDSVMIHASVQWELTKETVHVRLQDASRGGFSMLSEDIVPTGSRCRLVLANNDGDPAAVWASVEWQRKTAGGYLLGCAYLEQDAHRAVDRAIGYQVSAEAVSPAGSATSTLGHKTPAVAAHSKTAEGKMVIEDLPRQVGRAARGKMLAATMAMGASLFLTNMAQSTGVLAWGSAVVAILVAAAWTNSYHQLTNQVRSAAALERAGKL